MQVSAANAPSLDFSPTGLFPDKKGAENDKICTVVSKIFNDVGIECDMEGITQEQLRSAAQEHYDFYSIRGRLPLPEAEHVAFGLTGRGMSPEVAQELISCLLSEEDAQKWQMAKHP